MTTDQFVFLIAGITIGFDTALLVHFGGRIWDDYQDRRAIRRATATAEAREARLDALMGGERE